VTRATVYLEFRVWALTREVHEQYLPLWPSPLRDVTAASDLPDPEPSNDEVVDDAALNSPTESDTYSWGSEDLSSADCDEDMAVKSDDPLCQEGTSEEAEADGMVDVGK
jgi:hypothetical protein